eukprot:1765395-Lingulodinium_polyedra.AAC.1
MLGPLKLRVLLVRDIFHREWNDVRAAAKSSDLWWAVLLSTMVFNLSYGPWEGAAWHEKLKGSALELQAKVSPNDRFFQAFFPNLCRDRNIPVDGTTGQREGLLQEVMEVDALAAKGPRVA